MARGDLIAALVFAAGAFLVISPIGTVVDLTFDASRDTSVEEINALMTDAAKSSRFKGSLGLNGEETTLATLHERIRVMLHEQRRVDHDEACVLRLDPLILAAAQAGMAESENRLVSSLRREFGHQAHLAVTSAGQGVVVLAGRAAREDEVAVAIRRRLAAIAPARLSGNLPGILAMFVEDTDRTEWRYLREQLELEGEARQFLTHPEARCVVAVTCASRLELFGAAAPHAACDGELRFRNPSHPAAKAAALAPAVISTN